MLNEISNLSRRAFISATIAGVVGTVLPFHPMSNIVDNTELPVFKNDWFLSVNHGRTKMELTLDALSRFNPITRVVETPNSSPVTYSGVSIADLFAGVGSHGISRARVWSTASYRGILLSLSEMKGAIIAISVNGRPLMETENTPACLVIPHGTGFTVIPTGVLQKITVLGSLTMS